MIHIITSYMPEDGVITWCGRELKNGDKCFDNTTLKRMIDKRP